MTENTQDSCQKPSTPKIVVLSTNKARDEKIVTVTAAFNARPFATATETVAVRAITNLASKLLETELSGTGKTTSDNTVVIVESVDLSNSAPPPTLTLTTPLVFIKTSPALAL